MIDALLAEKLRTHLDNIEAQTAMQVIDAAHPLQEHAPVLRPGPLISLRLHEAVEEFGKAVHRMSQRPQQTFAANEWEMAAAQIHEALTSYFEILEGCSAELFRQVDQIGLEHWDDHFSSAIASIKDNVVHRLDDFIWGIRRLEQQLSSYQRLCQSCKGKLSLWRKAIISKQQILGHSLEKSAAGTLQSLRDHYRSFIEKYNSYLQLYKNAEKAMQSLHDCRSLASMDLDLQEKFKKVSLLMELWTNNLSSKAFSKDEIACNVRSYISPESALMLLREYYATIMKTLLDKSRMIKKRFRVVFHDMQARRPIIDNIAGCRSELAMLKSTSEKYRGFLMWAVQTPTIRARWGLSKAKKGEDLDQIKQLQSFPIDIEKLDGLCKGFLASIENEQAMLNTITVDLEQKVAVHLTEMELPLASKPILQKHASAILDSLKQLDEIASFHPEVVDYVCATLRKAIRADWKYHVLYEMALFHQLYEIHQAIVEPIEERRHLNRLSKFRAILERVEKWMSNNETLQHAHEIELSLNDIKAYLQDFFATVQAVQHINIQTDSEKLAKSVQKLNQYYLEYVYAFGKFFHSLNPEIPEARLIRRQFLFVDQYFAAIEKRL